MSSSTLDTDLVQRLKQALTTKSDGLKTVLNDPSVEVLHAALKNISLTEEHLLLLLKRQDLSSDILKAIDKHKLAQSHHVTVSIIRNSALPPGLTKQLMVKLRLFELLNLCILPGQSSDIRVAAEHSICQRLASEPLGNKISLAKRASSNLLLPLLKEGHPQIIEASLENTRLHESAIFQFLTSGATSAETISIIARHPRWSKRKNLQRAILKNHHTPQVWFIHFLPHLPTSEVRNLLHSSRLKTNQKKWIQDFLDKR